MRFGLSILILLAFLDWTIAQHNEQDSTSKSLHYHLLADSFLKNNEYFSPHTDGFTGIGLILQPHVTYKIDGNSSIKLGYHFLKYSGLDSFSEAIPLFSLQTSFYEGWTLIIGSIQGGAKHKLTEPLYRIDNDYQNRIEYGLQSLIKYDWITADVWLHWEQFIKKDDPFPEEVYGGSTARILIKEFDPVSIHLNTELLISHLGGQIDADDNPDRTLINYAIGPSLTYNLYDDVDVTFKYAYYKSSVVKQVADTQSQFYLPLDSGEAHYPQLSLKYKDVNLTMGYWSSDSFFSPRGEFLFSSLSDKSARFSEPIRNLWTNVLTYDFTPFPYLDLSLFGITYYDAIRVKIDYSYGIRFLLQLEF